MNITQGSLGECRYYLMLARDLEYIETNGLLLQLEEVSKFLDAYGKAVLTSAS